MITKDFFSDHSKLYATFRPTYPKELYDFIYSHTKTFDTAWDCATGNGQVASILTTKFKTVFATDISEQQLAHAVKADSIFYSVQPAEKVNFETHSIDLITVAQALHWINTERFYSEVNRVAKRQAIIALFGYSVCTINPLIDKLLHDFYTNKVGPFWDEARKIIDQEYSDIPFPFKEISSPKFFIKVHWSAEHFAGYLTSWSATQKFIHTHGYNPVPEFTASVESLWKGELEVKFPLFLRLGRL